MKKLLYISCLFLSIFFLGGCQRDLKKDSTVIQTSLPFLYEAYAEAAYASGVGEGVVYTSIPDIIALVVDTVHGFEGGHGGKSGSDSLYIYKKDLKAWPDTVEAGGYSITFEKYNKIAYKISFPINIVLAAPIQLPNEPGPTDIAGTYERSTNKNLFEIKKIFDGVYVIDNPGAGKGIILQPYLLFNYKSSLGLDSLAFATQTNPCKGGTKLVSPTAPGGLTSAEYSETYPPSITSLSPVTLSWKVLEFEDTEPGSAAAAAGICQWGTGARTFIKK